MLASFRQSGTTLDIDLDADSESVGIVSHGASYALTLDASHTWTGTDTADVAGSGSNTLTASAAAFTSIQVTDSNSGGAVTFEDSGGNSYAASFTIRLDNSPTGPVTFNGASDFGPSGLSVSTKANIIVSSGASVTIDDGQLALDASASQFQNAGTVSAGAGSLTITADSVAIQNTLTAAGGITLQPATDSQTIGLNDATGAFNLTSEELGYLASGGTVTIGAAAGVGAMRIGGAGAINLSLKNFDLALRGGAVTFVNRLQLPSTRTLILSTGAVTSAPAGSVDIQVGTLSLATGGAVGAANNPLAVDLANLRGAVSGDLFLTELNQVAIGEPLSTSDDQTIHLIGGQFILGANERIGDASRINVNGGTLNIGAWNETVRGVTLTSGQITGSGVLTSTTTFQVQNGTSSAKLGGAVGLIKTATGTVTLSGANQYTGDTVIEAGGVLRIDQDACLGRPPDGSASGRLELRGRLEATATLELAADREILLGDPSGTIVVPVSRTVTVKGNMVGDGLIKRGLGTLVLAGDNSFRGGVEYADQSIIRFDHANGFGTGTIQFSSNGTLHYGPGVTTDLSSQIAPWDPSVAVTINTGANQVVFASPLGHAGVAEPAPASGTLFKTGTGKLTLAPTDTSYPTQLKLLYVEEGEFAVTRGIFELLGSATPVASVYTGSTSLFVKNATLTIAGGTVLTQESLLLNYGAGANATLNVSSGNLEVPGDLVAGANRLATVNIGVRGGATTEIIVGGDFIVGLEGSSTVNISGGITQISGNLVAGQNGSGTVNVSGGAVNATSLRHLGGDDGALNLTGGTVDVDEVVHQTANNDSNDSLKVYLGAVNQDVRGTLMTQRMYLDRTGGTDDGRRHEFLLFFDGGTLEAKADGNLIDGITDEVGNPVWQGLIDAVGPLDASAFIDIPGNFDANVLRPLLHDPMLADTRDGGLTKQGTGTLTLWAENTFTGPVIIQSGTLALVNTQSDNTIPKALYIDVHEGTTLDVTGLDDQREDPAVIGTLILADGQTLLGYGTVEGRLIAAGGSIVSPGRSTFHPPGAPGVLSVVGNYTMDSGSTLDIEIYGNTIDPNDIQRQEYDQVEVIGEVRLNEATLKPPGFNGYRPVAADVFVIINNDGQDPVVGTFVGLPEGTVFDNFLNSGLPFRISYVGGDGNDVVIAYFAVPVPTIELVKTGSFQDENGDGNADPGETIRYRFAVTNTGNVTLTAVTLADPGITLAGGPIATLAPGQADTTTFTGSYAIRWEDIEAGSFANTATVTGLDPNQQPITAASRAIVPLPPPPLVVLGPDKNPGTLQEVRVSDGDQGDVFWQFVAYDSYVGGTRVAVADLNGDGRDEIITAPGRNHAPEIRIFTLQGDSVPGFPSFLAYDPTFISGVQLTVGYVDDDDLPDIITVPSYGAAEVRVFLNQYDPDDADHAIPAFGPDPDISFQAFPVASIGGAVVAAGDMGRRVGDLFLKEPDGRAEIVVGTGNGTPAAVAIFDVAGLTPTPVTEFVPFATSNPDFLGGVSLDVAPIDEDTIPDVIVGMGVNGTSRIEVWTWNASDANLSLLGAIPKAFTGSSSNASISVAAADTAGSGFAAALFAVQGPVGTTGEIHRFDIRVDRAAAPPFSYQQAAPWAGFTGPWFIATSKTASSASPSEPPLPIAPPPVNAWTNLVNPWDVNGDGRVTPLDVLETINHINVRAGETALPPQPLSPPRFFDSNADGAITPADALVVLNFINAGATSSGEGETNAPGSETDVISGFPATAPGLAMTGGESSAIRRRDQVFDGLDGAAAPDIPWQLAAPEQIPRRVPYANPPWGENIDWFDLEAALEEIAAEIAEPRTPWPARLRGSAS